MREVLEHCGGLPTRDLAEGEILIEQGERLDVMYVLEHGAVVIERDGVPFAFVDAPGSVLGELSVILHRPATATVRASVPSRLHIAADPEAFLRENPSVAVAVLRIVAARLEGLTAYLADIKRQFAHHDSHLGMIDDVLNVLLHHQPPEVRSGSARDPDPEY